MDDVHLLHDLLVIFAAAVAVSLVGARIGLPSLAGMIVAGSLIGPHALGLIAEHSRVESLAEVGVALLLFGIGIELPFGRLRELFRPMIVGGGTQVLLTGGCAFVAGRAFGLSPPAAVLVSFVVIPSSTAIVLRGLHARGELEAPHGRQMLGILLFQDLCVVPMMLVLPALTGSERPLSTLAWALARSLLVLLLVLALARLLAPKLLHLVAKLRQRDVFVLAVFGVVIGTAWAASLAQVSLALGAFLAGVVISGSAYRHQALGELMPFREVFASLFFVSAGMLLDASMLLSSPLEVFALLLALMLGKAAIVFALGAAMRLSLRAAIWSALGLAQVGEFALVLLESARPSHMLSLEFEGKLLTAAILSMIATPLLGGLAPKVVAAMERWSWLRQIWVGRSDGRSSRLERSGHIVIAGYGVAGRALALRLASEGLLPVIVDLNTKLVGDASNDGFEAHFGDVATPEILELLEVERAREVVLLISDASALERAVAAIRRLAPEVVLTVRARYEGEMPSLQKLGADHVVAAELEAGRAITAQVVRRHSRRPPA